ncbi:MAG: hypothetical protein K2X29_12410 [Candidatus Obscuribacterales bacterium]|nr:hypothetical protein [Candidatus Obscuribacterales bacterium]
MDIHRVFVSGKALGLTSLVAFAVLGTTVGVVCAQEPAPVGSEGSIFTPPASVAPTEPGFQPGSGFHKGGKGGKFRGGGRRHGGKNHMGWHQIQMLPSLTPTQRKEIRDIYQQAKADVQPDVEQIKAMKEQFKGRGPDGLSAENKEKFSAIKTRLKAKRESVWQQVKAKLTAEQLADLEKMRAGSLKPPAVQGAKDG